MENSLRRLATTTGCDLGCREFFSPAGRVQCARRESLAFSHDSRRIAACLLNEIVIYNISTGQQLAHFSYHNKHLRSLRFMPDDSALILAGEQPEMSLLDMTTGQSWNPCGAIGNSWCVACSPDGRRIATTGYDGSLRIWDSSSRLNLHRTELESQFSDGLGIATSPDGKRLAVKTSDGGYVAIWDISGSQPKRLLQIKPSNGSWLIYSLAFSPDGHSLAVGSIIRRSPDRDYLHLIDAATGVQQKTLSAASILQWLDYSADGQTIVAETGHGGAKDWKLVFLSLITGQIMDSLPIHGLEGVAIAPDGSRFATAATNDERRIEIFRFDDRKKVATSRDSFDQFTSLVFTPDGLHLVAIDNRVRNCRARCYEW